MKGCEPLTDLEIVNVANVMQGLNQHRNRALWWLGCQTGLRVSELLSLDIQQLQDARGAIATSINVAKRHTKGQTGGKVCVVKPLAAKAIAVWLTHARSKNGAERTWPLFHTTTGKRMTRFMVAGIIRGALRDAGIQHALLGTHTMRKTGLRIILEWLKARQQAGEQIDVYAELMVYSGHESISSLFKYIGTVQGLVDQAVEECWERIALIQPTVEPPKRHPRQK